MADDHAEMTCGVCGRTITLGRGTTGEAVVSVETFTRDHAECFAGLLAHAETFSRRRRRLIREAVRRAHDGPHGILRTLSETEAEFLLGPTLDLLEDLEEQRAADPRVIQLPTEAHEQTG